MRDKWEVFLNPRPSVGKGHITPIHRERVCPFQDSAGAIPTKKTNRHLQGNVYLPQPTPTSVGKGLSLRKNPSTSAGAIPTKN